MVGVSCQQVSEISQQGAQQVALKAEHPVNPPWRGDDMLGPYHWPLPLSKRCEVTAALAGVSASMYTSSFSSLWVYLVLWLTFIKHVAHFKVF